MTHPLSLQNLITNQLMPLNLHEPKILSAIASTPRHEFVPEHLKSIAYADSHLMIEPHRYLLSTPLFAKMLQAAAIKSSDKVLDIGCLYGYSSAVISRLAKKVVAIECADHFTSKAHYLLNLHHIHNVVLVHNQLYSGYNEHAPYQVILIHNIVHQIPAALLEQLDEGGRLVAIIWDGKIGRATLCEKHHNSFSTYTLFESHFTLPPHRSF